MMTSSTIPPQAYREKMRNLDKAANAAGFSWHDSSSVSKRDLLSALSIARYHGTVCSQRDYVVDGTGSTVCGRPPAGDLAGRPIGRLRILVDTHLGFS